MLEFPQGGLCQEEDMDRTVFRINAGMAHGEWTLEADSVS